MNKLFVFVAVLLALLFTVSADKVENVDLDFQNDFQGNNAAAVVPTFLAALVALFFAF
eukprot:CAMPEP_0184347854 /NCGR_PEP_ID=MMETSP1089-20130417/23227_1 /TAXON_ID=38269 ORGANISM="Gloeochaete wittrockiana, Strain SAG46.84" /NCGR_SAMPLE_ID=MMETSP1089 /ASSEMBLY_ACC=CAM_ASM_000445 /LENGTH=57 /DNA_ID=CAMNT_0026679219 /DNA_START=77 /DNA_END=250 /DNA_ORIENTATION=-